MTSATLTTVVRTRTAIPRWVIGMGVLAVLALIGQWGASPSAQRFNLGFRVQPQDDQMVINWVQPAGLGWDRQLRPGDVLISANGLPVTVNDDPQVLARADTITYSSGTVTHTITSLDNSIPTRLEEASLFSIAAIFALVGVAVFIIASDLLAAGILLANALIGSVVLELLATGIAGNPTHVTVLYAATAASAASLLLLAWVFPINWLKRRRFQIFAALSMLPTVTLISTFIVASQRNPRIYEWLRNLSYLNHVLNIIGALSLVAIALVRASPEQRPARRSMGIVGLGMLASSLPVLVLLIVPHFLGVRNLAPAWVATLGMIFMPISLGIAITSRQFLGVTSLVRRGLVALIVWLTLIGILSVAVRGFELWRSGRRTFGTENPFLTGLVIAAAAILLWPTQAWLRHRAEAFLFRDVYDYQKTLRQLSVEIVEIRGLEAIAEHVLSRLVTVLDLTWAKITLFTDFGGHEICHRSPYPMKPTPGITVSLESPARTEPLMIEHETIGMLSLGPKRHDLTHNPEDVELVTTLAPMIATALQSALLLRRLEDKVDQLVDREQELAALSGQLMQVQEEERRRLALDLHDDPLQRAILLARQISETSPPLDRTRLRSEADEIISALRAICSGLRPPVLDDFGLVEGLEALVNEARARSDLNITLEIETVDVERFGRLERELETALYRVAQEALNNCIKHASATSVDVILARTPNRITLRVSDDGNGLVSETQVSEGVLHLGLLGMRERLQPWDGVVKVDSSRESGTTVFVHLPMRGDHEQTDDVA